VRLPNRTHRKVDEPVPDQVRVELVWPHTEHPGSGPWRWEGSAAATRDLLVALGFADAVTWLDGILAAREARLLALREAAVSAGIVLREATAENVARAAINTMAPAQRERLLMDMLKAQELAQGVGDGAPA